MSRDDWFDWILVDIHHNGKLSSVSHRVLVAMSHAWDVRVYSPLHLEFCDYRHN